MRNVRFKVDATTFLWPYLRSPSSTHHPGLGSDGSGASRFATGEVGPSFPRVVTNRTNASKTRTAASSLTHAKGSKKRYRDGHPAFKTPPSRQPGDNDGGSAFAVCSARVAADGSLHRCSCKVHFAEGGGEWSEELNAAIFSTQLASTEQGGGRGESTCTNVLNFCDSSRRQGVANCERCDSNF